VVAAAVLVVEVVPPVLCAGLFAVLALVRDAKVDQPPRKITSEPCPKAVWMTRIPVFHSRRQLTVQHSAAPTRTRQSTALGANVARVGVGCTAELNVHADKGATATGRREERDARAAGASVWPLALSKTNDARTGETSKSTSPRKERRSRRLVEMKRSSRDVQRPAAHRRQPHAEG